MAGSCCHICQDADLLPLSCWCALHHSGAEGRVTRLPLTQFQPQPHVGVENFCSARQNINISVTSFASLAGLINTRLSCATTSYLVNHYHNTSVASFDISCEVSFELDISSVTLKAQFYIQALSLECKSEPLHVEWNMSRSLCLFPVSTGRGVEELQRLAIVCSSCLTSSI